jgi:hypothetical protein
MGQVDHGSIIDDGNCPSIKDARLAGSVYRSNMAAYCCITESFFSARSTLALTLVSGTEAREE